MQERRYTLEEVWRSYTPEKRWSELEGDLPSFLVFRPLSIWLTPPLLWVGVTPTGVTLTTAALACALPLAASLGGARGATSVALLAFLAHVLDCVDGNIARTTGVASPVGALLDGFVDLLFWTLYLLAIGILASRSAPPWLGPHAVALSLGLALLVLLHRHLRDSYAATFAERAEFRAERPARLKPMDLARMVVISLERFYFVAVVAGGLTGAMGTVLLAIAGYVFLIFVGAVALTFHKAAARQRRSGGRPP